MFALPDTAPWWAVLAVVVFGLTVLGVCGFVRAVWPQNSAHRKFLLQEWQQERARRRRELGGKQ